jgi:hypothetical protein
MQFESFSFGSLRIDGSTYHHDVNHRSRRGPQTPEEAIQEISRGLWTHAALCGGGNSLEVPPIRSRDGRIRKIASDERSAVRGRAAQVKLLILPTIQAIEALQQDPDDTQAILHVKC